jgi:fructose-bisphosphate aldolase class II
MPLTSIRRELEKAQAGGYALPLFDTFEMLGTQGMLDAMEEKCAPAMISIYSGLLDEPRIGAFAAYIRALAEGATVPVSLMLDHGGSFEHCMKALSLGFTDVMYDGSELPLEENIANTRMVVRAAHAAGAAAEAELGHVGQGSEYAEFGSQRKGFTDPAVAAHFVEETGVDFLAVAIGSAHGLYEGEPQLDLELLEEIEEAVDIPLVLHGGSGLRDQQFREAIERGICKVNIFTDLSVTARDRMKAAAKEDDASYFTITAAIREAFKERCGHFLDVFGASGKA